jgi:hypothetical protein
VWSPHPAEVVGIAPVAISIEIFSAPNVFVVVLNVVFEPLREIALAVAYPGVNRVMLVGCKKLPVACAFAAHNELSGTTVAQIETGSV